MDELMHLDRKLDDISRRIAIGGLNPLNTDTEKRRFFTRKGYEPQFRYRPVRTDSSQVMRMLSSVKPDDSPVGRILSEIRDKYVLDLKLIKARGTKRFSLLSKEVHGAPDQWIRNTAQKYLALNPEPESPDYSSTEVLQKLRLAFVKYGFHWTVEQRAMIANAAVKIRSKKLLIKRGTHFSKDFIKRIIVHEIGTHITRAENGEYQPYTFFARGFPGYLRTEEGLAVYNEEINHCLNDSVLKMYAGRVVAISTALDHSFRDTYTVLRTYFTKNDAWRLTVRAKRGLEDTTEPGAFTKDLAYLQGYLDIKRYASEGNDMNRLYYGKIGLSHVSIIDEIPGLVRPELLPMYRYTNYFKGHFSSIIERVLFPDHIQNIRLDQFRF
jgi:uncharacterized protein (TIGR02421 family)